MRLPINVLPASGPTFSHNSLLASMSSTRQMRHSSRKRPYISLACNTPFHFSTASRGILSFYNTLAVQKNHTQVKTERAGTGPGHKHQLCTMLDALAPLSFLLTTNLSDSVFDDDLGAMQMLAQRRRVPRLPTSRDAFLGGTPATRRRHAR